MRHIYFALYDYESGGDLSEITVDDVYDPFFVEEWDHSYDEDWDLVELDESSLDALVAFVVSESKKLDNFKPKFPLHGNHLQWQLYTYADTRHEYKFVLAVRKSEPIEKGKPRYLALPDVNGMSAQYAEFQDSDGVCLVVSMNKNNRGLSIDRHESASGMDDDYKRMLSTSFTTEQVKFLKDAFDRFIELGKMR